MPTDIARSSVNFLGIDFDSGSYEQVASKIDGLSRSARFSYVVTPNVDHVLTLNPRHPNRVADQFQQAYDAAALTLCDSRILQRLARIRGVTLDVITGSDLTAYLFKNGWLSGRSVALVGGDADMVPELQQLYPAVRLVQHQPPMRVLSNADAVQDIIAFIEQQRADYVLLAIGAPQSEIIAHRCLQAGKSVGVGLCIGASIEFLLGRKQRAPQWMQRFGLEWAFRLAEEPRRLWRRYLVTGPRIFRLAAQWKRA